MNSMRGQGLLTGGQTEEDTARHSEPKGERERRRDTDARTQIQTQTQTQKDRCTH